MGSLTLVFGFVGTSLWLLEVLFCLIQFGFYFGLVLFLEYHCFSFFGLLLVFHSIVGCPGFVLWGFVSLVGM